MLNSETLIAAMSDIDGRHILEAGQKLGYTGQKGKTGRKKTLRVLLIAAAVSALFAATAAAAGWFGFSSRVTPAEDPLGLSEGGYISMNDYADTPAGQAHAEWCRFWEEYVRSHEFENYDDLSWLGGSEELESYYHIYAAYDQTMMDKLLEIRDQYGIALHTEAVNVPNLEYFYKVLGIEPFIDESLKSSLFPKAIYEDGSFSAEGAIYFGEYSYLFSLIKGMKGVLDPSFNYLYRAEDYQEWQYTTSKGQLLNLAVYVGSIERGALDCFIFCEGADCLVTVFGSLPCAEDRVAAVEEYAELFDYGILCNAKPDLSSVLDTAPAAVKPKGELLTLADWVETDEYKAATEFQLIFRDYTEATGEFEYAVKGYPSFFYYGSFPTGIGSLDEAYNRILEEYALQPAGKAEAVWGGQKVPAEYLRPDGGLKCPEGVDYTAFPYLTEEEIYEMLGCGDFFPGDESINLAIAYDNGAFLCYNNRVYVHYIPKGCFYPLMRYCLHPEMEGWAYDTACGEQVYITQAGEMVYPVGGYSTIIYETDLAYVIALNESGQNEPYYLELLADSIDFTKFK